MRVVIEANKTGNMAKFIIEAFLLWLFGFLART
jgi:hypothetical protein